MQIINQIGHIQHWGLTPALNFLPPFHPHPHPPHLRILLTGCSDIRHLLKTLSDLDALPLQSQPTTIEVYFHEVHKQLLCRALLLLQVIHETKLNYEERVELFLDLYGNALIKQRNSQYLDRVVPELLNLIHEEKKVKTVLKEFVKLKMLKFEERDEMAEIIQSWSSKVPFDIVKLRDQRLRYMFKQRYDYRNNLIDWDYNMLLTPEAPIVHFYHYKQWRLTGLAFQHRFSTYTQPNRTLASYVPGRKKQQRTSCIVRGYWGDMIISPYVAMGVQTDSKQKQLLFKKVNMKYVGHSVELTEYNLRYWLERLEAGTEYVRYFRDYYRTDERGKEELERRDKRKKQRKQGKGKEGLGEIKEEEEEEVKEKEINKQGENNEQKQRQKQVQQPRQPSPQPDQQLDSQQQLSKQSTLTTDSTPIASTLSDPCAPLHLFHKYNLSFHPLSMPIQSLTKPKFHQFFDVIVCGFVHAAYCSKQRNLQSTLKKGGRLWVETGRFMVPKKVEERREIRERLRGMVQGLGVVQNEEKGEGNYVVVRKE